METHLKLVPKLNNNPRRAPDRDGLAIVSTEENLLGSFHGLFDPSAEEDDNNQHGQYQDSDRGVIIPFRLRK